MSYVPPSVARGSVQAFVYRAVELVAQVVLVVLTARLLRPEGRGLYALASLTAMLCSLPLGAVWSANAIEVAKRRTPLPELMGALMVIAAVGGAVTALVAFALTPWLGDHWWVVAFPAATAPMILFARYQEGFYQALGHIRAVNIVTLLRVLLPLGFTLAPLLAGAGPRTVVAIWTLWLVVLPIVMYPPLRGMVGGHRLPRERGLYRRLVSTGAKLSVANTALLVNARIAMIALAVFDTSAAVGVYSVAVAAGDVLYLTANSLQSSAFRSIGTRAPDASAELTARTVRHSILFATGVGLALVPVVLFTLPWFVGNGYGDVPRILLLLLPGIVGLAGFWALHTYFTVQLAKPRIVTRIAMGTLAVNIALSLALVPVAGEIGAALSTSLANGAGALMCFRRFCAESGLPMRDLRPGRRELRDYVTLAGTLAARYRQVVAGARS